MRARARILVVAFAVALAAGESAAQNRSAGSVEIDTLIPVPDIASEEPEIRLRFQLFAELPLEGPLPADGPRAVGDTIVIDLASGTATATWDGRLETGAPAAVATPPQPAAAGDGPVAFSPDRTFRATPLETGWILGEELCTSMGKLFSRREWCRRWKVRAPGSRFARPLVTERRVYYGTTDNRVYCVRRGSGHRVWDSTVDGRVLRPLELVRVDAPPGLTAPGRRAELKMEVLLVIPDGGDSILALDALTGATLATYELEENESLVGGPVAHEGKVAVARQRYDARDAALLLLTLGAAPPDFGPPPPAAEAASGPTP